MKHLWMFSSSCWSCSGWQCLYYWWKPSHFERNIQKSHDSVCKVNSIALVVPLLKFGIGYMAAHTMMKFFAFVGHSGSFMESVRSKTSACSCLWSRCNVVWNEIHESCVTPFCFTVWTMVMLLEILSISTRTYMFKGDKKIGPFWKCNEICWFA